MRTNRGPGDRLNACATGRDCASSAACRRRRRRFGGASCLARVARGLRRGTPGARPERSRFASSVSATDSAGRALYPTCRSGASPPRRRAAPGTIPFSCGDREFSSPPPGQPRLRVSPRAMLRCLNSQSRLTYRSHTYRNIECSRWAMGRWKERAKAPRRPRSNARFVPVAAPPADPRLDEASPSDTCVRWRDGRLRDSQPWTIFFAPCLTSKGMMGVLALYSTRAARPPETKRRSVRVVGEGVSKWLTICGSS